MRHVQNALNFTLLILARRTPVASILFAWVQCELRQIRVYSVDFQISRLFFRNKFYVSFSTNFYTRNQVDRDSWDTLYIPQQIPLRWITVTESSSLSLAADRYLSTHQFRKTKALSRIAFVMNLSIDNCPRQIGQLIQRRGKATKASKTIIIEE